MSEKPGSVFYYNSDGFSIKDILAPLNQEKVITKTVNSAFIGINLNEYLKSINTDKVVIAGFLRKTLGASAVILDMGVLLYLMVGNYHDRQTAMQRATEDSFRLLMTMSLWAFLFGVLMGWKALYNLIIDKRIKVNWLLIPAVLLAIN